MINKVQKTANLLLLDAGMNEFKINPKYLGLMEKRRKEYNDVQWVKQRTEQLQTQRVYQLLVIDLDELVSRVSSEKVDIQERKRLVKKGIRMVESSSFYPFAVPIDQIIEARNECEAQTRKLQTIKTQFTFLSKLLQSESKTDLLSTLPDLNSSETFDRIVRDKINILQEQYTETLEKLEKCQENCDRIEEPVEDVSQLLSLYIKLLRCNET